MRQTLTRVISLLAATAVLLSACGTATTAQPTVDPAAISTAAAQTVEARFTEQAAQVPPTETPLPPSATPELQATPIEPTPAPGATSNGKPCYAATFVADVTVPDGMIVAPGSTFTKTWSVRNDGNCVWDKTYSLMLASGDTMGTVEKVPLTTSVYPGDTVNLSIDLTAPTTEGVYTGYWRIATPYGGSIGVGSYDQALIVSITVSAKPERDFTVVSVVYDWTREPQKGCNAKGAAYTFTATVTANAAGDVVYRWDRNPNDGIFEGGKLKFTAAGSKVVKFTWSFQKDAVQNVDRWVALTIVQGSGEKQFDRILFYFTCDEQ